MNPTAHLKPVARRSLKRAAAGIDRFRPPPAGVTVLIYHRVGAGSGGQMDLAPDEFDDQLAWLVDHCRLLSLDAALDELADEDQAAPIAPAVVLTFDDGTTDWVDHVLPALDRRRVPATFYVATEFVEERSAFPGEGRPISWSGLAEMRDSELVTLGSHTHRHALLDRLPADQVADELDRSVELLADRLGVTAEHFAYPKALPGSAEAERQVRRRFRSAVLAGTRANARGADPFRLARSPIQPSDGTEGFRRKAAGGMWFEDAVRSNLNRIRHRSSRS